MEPTSSGVWASLMRLGQSYNTQSNHTVVHGTFTTCALTTIARTGECPRGPLSMCFTTGTYICCTSLQHDLRSIVKLRLIDTSTTVILHTSRRHTHVGRANTTHPQNVCLTKKIADAKQACLIVINYDSPTEQQACLIVENYDSPTAPMPCEINGAHFGRLGQPEAGTSIQCIFKISRFFYSRISE